MRYAIIGHGAAGNAAAAAIRKQDLRSEVRIFSDEPQPAYYRPLITSLLAGERNKDIFFPVGPENQTASGPQLGQKIVSLDSEAQRFTLRDGRTYTYDRLLLATGATAILPDIPGLPGPGTFVLRTLADAQALAAAAAQAKQVVIIGAGRVGLKTALALRQRGLEVTIVEQGPGLAPMQFDQEASDILAQALSGLGINLLLGQTITAVQRTGGRITGAALAAGGVLEAQAIVAAVGVRPNLELARLAGLSINQGIVVDRQLRTSAPEIYAAGDVVETTDLVTGQSLVSGLWTNAMEMGRIAGSNMAGAQLEYPGAWGVLNALEVAGIATVGAGLTNPPPGVDYQIHRSRRGNNYRKLVCQDGILVGALLVGDLDGAGVYAGLIRGRSRIGDPLKILYHPRRSLASRLSGTTSQA